MLVPKTPLTPHEVKKKIIREIQICTRDPEYFIENYCFAINPDKPPKERVVPFKLWPVQKKLLKQLLTYTDTFVEKSREMGCSWLTMAFELHQALFTDYFTCLNISRREAEVQDSGCTFHSLMGRIKFMYDHLPKYMQLKIHAPFLTFRVIKTGSIIKGESSNKSAGRDTQYKMIFVDEAAHIDCFAEMYKSCRNSSDCLFLNSTPPTDPFDNKYVEIKNMTASGYTQLRFNWREHPEKDQAWYKKKTAGMSEEEIGQELEISYDRKKVERSYIEYAEEIHLSNNKFLYHPQFPLIVGMDFGLAAEVMLFFQQDKDKRLYLIHEYEEANKLTPEHYHNFLVILGKLGYKDNISDIEIYGDPFSGNRRHRTSGETVIQQYHQASGGRMKIRIKTISFDEKRRCAKALLKARTNGLPTFKVSSACRKFSKCMGRCRINKQGKDHVDDWSTHKVNAWEYVVSNKYPIIDAAIIDIIIPNQPNLNNRNLIHNSILTGKRMHGRENVTLRSVLSGRTNIKEDLHG